MNYNYSIDDNNEHTGDGHRSTQRPPPKWQGMGLRPLRWRVLGTFYSFLFLYCTKIYLHVYKDYVTAKASNTQGRHRKEFTAQDVFASRTPIFFDLF